uniref:Uncharacterized protein n=1 Tax=Sipha flava TaxID=143950 RepID=A0A2S2Q175_9HEMI
MYIYMRIVYYVTISRMCLEMLLSYEYFSDSTQTDSMTIFFIPTHSCRLLIESPLESLLLKSRTRRILLHKIVLIVITKIYREGINGKLLTDLITPFLETARTQYYSLTIPHLTHKQHTHTYWLLCTGSLHRRKPIIRHTTQPKQKV